MDKLNGSAPPTFTRSTPLHQYQGHRPAASSSASSPHNSTPLYQYQGQRPAAHTQPKQPGPVSESLGTRYGRTNTVNSGIWKIDHFTDFTPRKSYGREWKGKKVIAGDKISNKVQIDPNSFPRDQTENEFIPGQRFQIVQSSVALRKHCPLVNDESPVVTNLHKGTKLRLVSGIQYEESGRMRVEVVTEDEKRGWLSLKTPSNTTLLRSLPEEV